MLLFRFETRHAVPPRSSTVTPVLLLLLDDCDGGCAGGLDARDSTATIAIIARRTTVMMAVPCNLLHLQRCASIIQNSGAGAGDGGGAGGGGGVCVFRFDVVPFCF